jgi:hypothetical protein
METPATPVYIQIEKRKAYTAFIVETLCAVLIFFVTLFIAVPLIRSEGFTAIPIFALVLCGITFLALILVMISFLGFTALFKKWAYWRRKRWNNIFLFAGFTLGFGIAIALYFFPIEAANYRVLYRVGVTLDLLASLSYALKGLFSLLFTKVQPVYVADKLVYPDGLQHDNAEFTKPDAHIGPTKIDPDQVIEVDAVDKKDRRS